MRAAIRLRLACLALGCAAACSTLVGIEDAKLDPQSLSGGASNSGAGGSSANGNQSGSSGAAGAGATLCDEYCGTVMQNCTGSNAVYTSSAVCQRVCAELPLGTAGDTTGDSVECRLSHAHLIEVIGAEAPTECAAAGPGGDGVCGENCGGFCELLAAFCPPDLSLECPADCKPLPDLGGYNVGESAGNSVQCRLYHVSAAAIDPVTHCPHAAGIGPCMQ